jgi:hypothetical protein
MAERGGFEPPIDLRLCLISSQVHSTGLCHLSLIYQQLSRSISILNHVGVAVVLAPVWKTFTNLPTAALLGADARCEEHTMIDSDVWPGTPIKSSDFRSGQYKSTGKGVSVAIPRSVLCPAS